MLRASGPVLKNPSWVLLTALLLIGCVEGSSEVARGCAKWTPSGTTDVCCERCKPGNRLVKKCGVDPRELCVPCEDQTYTLHPMQQYCHRCTQCIGVQFVKQPCSSSSDAVCGCREGYLCGDEHCTYCVEECGRGQEPTEKRTCRACPEGTFNDQIHQRCTPWTTSCPEPHQWILSKGTSVSDIICGNASLPDPNVIPTTRDSSDAKGWMVIVIAFLCLCLSLCLVIPFACVIAGKFVVKKKSTKQQVVEKATEGPHRLVQQEDCSFCHPQQEEGGSTGSVNSQDSEMKLLPV